MKKKLLLVLFSLMLVSCSRQVPTSKNKDINLSFEENEYFKLDSNTFKVEKNNDLAIKIYFEDNTTFSLCDYTGDYNYLGGEDGNGTLILYNVCYPQFIHIDVKYQSNGIRYNLNGGEFIEPTLVGQTFTKWYDISSFKRTNTEIGVDTIKKDGYLLTGWSTAQGERIGLGSRVSLIKDNVIDLYAIWEKEADTSLFTFSYLNNKAYITNYKGEKDVDTLVFPKSINDYPIVGIRRNAFKNFNANSVVFSENFELIESRSFENSNVHTLRFFDSIQEMYSDSFYGGRPNTWQINAFMKPRYQKENDNAQFANDIDHMIWSQDANRILFYGGCSMSYGLKCEVINETFTSYQAYNLGVIGGSTSNFAFDIIAHYVHEGDIFVHAPEVASRYQLMDDIEAEIRLFIQIEGNYDIFQYAKANEIERLYETWNGYQLGRKKVDECKYSDELCTYNKFGDICIDRTAQSIDVRHNKEDDPYSYDASLINSISSKRLIEKYDAIASSGAKVFFSYGPVNKNGLSIEDTKNKIWLDFEYACENMLKDTDYKIISKAEDYLLSGRYFYDTDYHLNDLGATNRSQKLVNDLLNAGVKN